jgi:hypothetical protein
MRGRLFQTVAVLAGAAMLLAARPARAQAPCFNPATDQGFCTATDAINAFISQVNFFTASGFISAANLQCLTAFAAGALSNLGSSSTVAQGENQLAFLINQILSLTGGGQLPLPVSEAALANALLGLPPAAPLPSTTGGTILSNCFINLRCPVVTALNEIILVAGPDLFSIIPVPPGTPSSVLATFLLPTPFTRFGTPISAACEFERRLLAETLAGDLLCAIQLASQGHVTTNPGCVPVAPDSMRM